MVDQDFVDFYEEVSLMLALIVRDANEDTINLIMHKWLRSDPECTGSRAREKIRLFKEANL